MGIWRSAGEFPVVERQKEMRAQRPLNARQPANEHRRVLAAGHLSEYLEVFVINISSSSLTSCDFFQNFQPF
jgi:hypothetical protein